MSDFQTAVAEAIALAPAQGPELLDILSADKIADLLAAHRRGERGPLFLVCMPKYAPKDTAGWVYTVDRINKVTVILTPVGGGRGLRADPRTLVEADADDLRAYAKLHAKLRETDGGATDTAAVHTGVIVRIGGPGWTQPEDALWVVVGLKGMTHVAVARLGGEAGGRTFPKIPVTHITAVIGPNGLAAAMLFDERFAS